MEIWLNNSISSGSVWIDKISIKPSNVQIPTNYKSEIEQYKKTTTTRKWQTNQTECMTYLSTTNLVKTKSRLKKTGLECSWLTALSISGCDRMKFSTVSGKLDVSSTHVPGRGSGIFDFSTGNHAEFDVACSLNFPAHRRKRKTKTNWANAELIWIKHTNAHRHKHARVHVLK